MALSRDIGDPVRMAAFVAVMAAVGSATEAAPVCSVFDNQPCAPTVCSPFRDGPCIPEYDPPIGQDLRLTIESRQDADKPPTEAREDRAMDRDHFGASVEREIGSIADLFAALRACWAPPALADAQPGMQMSVRFAFKRSGEIISSPRVTYVAPGTPGEVRARYHAAITAALERCTPMPFTRGMGGAVAGRPIAIRFVDNRRGTDAAASTTTQNAR